MDEPFVKIDLHGMRADEAERVLEKAVKDAGSGTYQIQAIHGFNRGTALRDMIYDSFKYNNKVKRVIPGENQGITILVLKELY
ncbi:MAG: Smr/MutS family protein [Lachnospiraceae bacterium]|nr:Smr/MutS family protein [Lachnospiraceae bacterium]